VLRPYPAELMRVIRCVRVGNIRNNDAELLTETAANDGLRNVPEPRFCRASEARASGEQSSRGLPERRTGRQA